LIRSTDNPLNNLLSYAIHYRVFVTSDLNYAHQLAKYLDTNELVRTASQSDVYGNLERPLLKTETNIPYYDLIDSRIDADLLVTKFLIKNLVSIASDTRRGLGSTLEMELKLHESYSGWLIQFLQKVNTVQSIQPHFIIKPFFVGIDANQQKVDLKINYHYIMIMTNITAQYSTLGSDYEINGVCDINGMGNFPATHTPILDQLSVSFPPNLSIADAIENNFSIGINDVALSQTVPDTPTIKFTRTKYKFIVSNAYKNNTSYNIDTVMPISTTTGKNDIIMSFKGCSVSEALIKILIKSKAILDDAQLVDSDNSNNSKEINGVTYYGKYRPYITSKSEFKDSVIEITYTIHKRKFFTSSDPLVGLSDEDDYDAVKSFQQYINQNADGTDFSKNDIFVYDYVFTGKNVDVINYKLSLTQGIVSTFAKQDSNTFNNFSFKAYEQLTINTDAILCNQQNQCPIKPTTGVSLSTENLKVSKFYDALNKASFFEVLANEITVVGNPILLGRITQNVDSQGEQNISLDSVPFIIYVNAKYPVSSNFWEYTTNNTDQPLLAPFWFQGPQQIIHFDTVFEGNNFYHIITTLPLLKNTNVADIAIKTNTPTSDSSKSLSKSSSTNIAKIGEFKTSLGGSIAQPPNSKPPTFISFKSGTPLKKHVVTDFYYTARVREVFKRGAKHKVPSIHFGTDLRAAPGTDVFAPITGKMRVYTTIEPVDKIPGWRIDITNPEGVTVRFFHITPLNSFKPGKVYDVVAGDKVCTTKQIKYPHLHIELHYKGQVFNCVSLLDGVTYDVK